MLVWCLTFTGQFTHAYSLFCYKSEGLKLEVKGGFQYLGIRSWIAFFRGAYEIPNIIPSLELSKFFS